MDSLEIKNSIDICLQRSRKALPFDKWGIAFTSIFPLLFVLGEAQNELYWAALPFDKEALPLGIKITKLS